MPVNYQPEYKDSERRSTPRLRARDIMTSRLITFDPEMNIYEAVDILVKKKITGGPVVDKEGNHVGMLSEKDCLRRLITQRYHDLPDEKVQDYMSEVIYSVDADTEFFRVAQIFVETPYRRLPVIDKGKLVGQVSRRDCMLAMQKTMKKKKR